MDFSTSSIVIGIAVVVIAVFAALLVARSRRKNRRRSGYDVFGGPVYRPGARRRSGKVVQQRSDRVTNDDLTYEETGDLEDDLADDVEDEADKRLRALRRLQRAEKIREAQEEAAKELKHDHIDTRNVVEIEDESERRLRQLREFQRAEKIREAQEDLERGIAAEQERPPSIGKIITEEVIDLHKQEQHYQDLLDRAEVERVVAEAQDLIVDLNAQYGWTPGEPSIADRLFNTDVESVLGTAKSEGKVDFRTRAMINHMRSFARASTGGRNELAKVMATRTLLGAGRLTEEELGKLDSARRLFGDEFAEASGYVDHMERSQEKIQARRLGLQQSPERPQDSPIANRGLIR